MLLNPSLFRPRQRARRACILLSLVGCSSGGETADAGETTLDATVVVEAGTDAPSAVDAQREDDDEPVMASDASSSATNPKDAANTQTSDAAQTLDATTSADASKADSSMHTRICGDTASWPAPLPAQDQRKAEVVGTQTFGSVEGPVWIADQGVLLFSDMDFNAADDSKGPPARIRRLTPPATFDVFSTSSNSNGLALMPDGTLIAATHDTQSLSLFNLQSAARTQLTVLTDGKHFNSPNDLTVRSDGTVFFTDPDWQLGSRTSETQVTGVYRVTAPLKTSGSNAATLIEGTLDKPNGIALSLDEQTLYIGSNGSEIWKYKLASDGGVSNRTKFADTGSSDGMTVDCAGNLYVVSGSIQVFEPNGNKLGEISVADTPSNVAFGGADRKTLYITASPHLYSIKLNVPGYPY